MTFGSGPSSSSPGALSERARYRKAKRLVIGRSNKTPIQTLLPRALAIISGQRNRGARLSTGTKQARNHQPDMPAARSIGTNLNTGSQTRMPGGFPVFRQINMQQ